MEAEIWNIWLELAQENLPLPLGGMALRRSLPLSDAIKIERDLTNAVKIANSNRRILAPMLMERNLIRVNEEKLDTYLNLYANKNSICMSETQFKAVDVLLNWDMIINFMIKSYMLRIILSRASMKNLEILKKD